jgi:hypothetical protein
MATPDARKTEQGAWERGTSGQVGGNRETRRFFCCCSLLYPASDLYSGLFKQQRDKTRTLLLPNIFWGEAIFFSETCELAASDATHESS